MKKTLAIFLFTVLLASCKQAIRDADIPKMNGYWEIEKVELPNGDKKDYKVNETIDYFKVQNNKGFRQKVMPQLDGTYRTNDLKEQILITKENGSFYANYKTNYAKWKEEIIEIRDSVLVMKNQDNLEYHYKKQIPFSLK